MFYCSIIISKVSVFYEFNQQHNSCSKFKNLYYRNFPNTVHMKKLWQGKNYIKLPKTEINLFQIAN
jgi:hypothetical protein